MTTVKGRDIDGKIVVLQRSQPEQLTLFQYFPNHLTLSEDPHACANTIDLYDVMPKYVASHRKVDALRREGKSLDILVRQFVHNKQVCRLEITPAKLLTKDGKTKEFYPTEREQLIEEALRKIACHPASGCFLNDKAGVRFTLYQLRQELQRMGHSIHLASLIEALKIANKVNITLSTRDDETLVSAPIFPVLVKTSRKEWLEKTNEAFCYVQFNPLVTAGINQLNYRQHNYCKFMHYRRQLTRWLHKKLYNAFTQASFLEAYTIMGSSIIRDSGLVCDTQERNRFATIEAALEELKDQCILSDFRVEKVREGRKLVDVKYSLRPCGEFIGEMVNANRRKKLFTEQTKAKDSSTFAVLAS